MLWVDELHPPKHPGRSVFYGEYFTWLLNINSVQVFDAATLAAFKGRALNMHPAPLPKYAGLFCHYWAFENGETEWAATIHYMDEGIDTGPTIMVQSISIKPEHTPAKLFMETMWAGAGLMCLVADMLTDGTKLLGLPQDLSRRRLYTRAMAVEHGFVQ